ncbi:hypothetical protein ACP70R_032330 [Stipagrostis hirtigluma subsp. patula]
MAEAVVGVVIFKLGATLAKEAAAFGASLLLKEASALKGFFGEIRDVKEELESMQAYLRAAEKLKNSDETTAIFVKKIRGFAFEIEDVIDEFTYKLEDKHGGFAAKMRRRIQQVKTWRRLAHKLRDIKDRLQGADERRNRYALTGMDTGSGGSNHHDRSIDRSLHFTRDEDLVGIEENKEKLIQWLTGDLEQRSKIATVWGMGGVGKTTLVAHVYNIVKADFDQSAWVTVSKTYQVADLLMKIAREFDISSGVSNMEARSLVEAIGNYLEGKKYILILDDVWGTDVWFKIRDTFPTNCVSRFVFTSRKYEVALLATSNCAIQLEPLQEHQSWDLFCKEAFWKKDNKECPTELRHFGQKFVEKSNGLPIAIACIGRLLSCRHPTCSEWEGVYKELDWQLTNNVILDVNNIILKISLDDLPRDVKNCFLHCALFPEDYPIKKSTVLRHWITAGFIRENENKTLEEVAEGYLNDLVNRSLLQVVEKNDIGGVRSCRMHDVIRLLALNRAAEECFCKVYDGSETFSLQGARRLSIQSANIEQLSWSGAAHLRALHVFESCIKFDFLKNVLTSSKLLTTLDLQGVHIKMLPSEVFDLCNLRLLGLRRTSIVVLPEAIGRLQNLEVLDAFSTELLSLPNSLGKLRKLRYLYACATLRRGAVEHFGGVVVPKSIKQLTSLYVLQYIKANLESLRDAAALIELRTFGVSGVRSEQSAYLCNAIMNMSYLKHLSITVSDENEVLQLEALDLPQTLSKLRLEGQLEKKSMPQVLSSWSHLNNLKMLHLKFSKLNEDSFSSLLVLHGLCWLDLAKAFEGKKLHFSAGSFPKLKYLRRWNAPKLNQAEIEEGAMQSLVELVFRDCPELRVLPHGIEHLTALERLRLHETSEELIEKLRQMRGQSECNGDLLKINHVRNVTVRLVQKGLWERIR